MSHFGIFLTNHKKKTVELPVAPAELKTALEVEAVEHPIANVGDVTVLGHNKPKELELSVLIPRDVKNFGRITAKETLADGDAYINFIDTWTQSKQAGRVVITSTSINFACRITAYEAAFKDGDDSVWIVTLKLKEYREVKVRKLKVKANKVAKTGVARPARGVLCVGVTVIANGRVHLNSWGAAPGIALSNYRGKVNLVAPGRSHPYHVTTMEGTHLGWMTHEAVRMA